MPNCYSLRCYFKQCYLLQTFGIEWLRKLKCIPNKNTQIVRSGMNRCTVLWRAKKFITKKKYELNWKLYLVLFKGSFLLHVRAVLPCQNRFYICYRHWGRKGRGDNRESENLRCIKTHGIKQTAKQNWCVKSDIPCTIFRMWCVKKKIQTEVGLH